MNFPPADPHRFLLQSIPDRFEKLTPDEFTAFIRYLFQLDGYEVKPVVISSDLGDFLQAVREGSSLIILPVRHQPDEMVEVEVIEKAIQARRLYKTDQAWVVTTSGFSPEAEALAEEEDVELWDWDTLYTGICELFFEGKNHLEHVAETNSEMEAGEESSVLKLKVKWMPQEGVDPTWFNLHLQVSNPSDRNIYIHLELPALINTQKSQVFADHWGTDDFVSGLLYAGASVHTNAAFKVSKLGDRPPAGNVVLTYHERRDPPVTFHLNARVKGEACYLVTYCYSRGSEEYRQMIWFRDHILQTFWLGRRMITLYYLISPGMVDLAFRYRGMDALLRKTVTPIVKWCMQLNAKQDPDLFRK